MTCNNRFVAHLICVAAMASSIVGLTHSATAQTNRKTFLPVMYRDAPERPSIFGIHFDFGPATPTTVGFDRLTTSRSSWSRLQPGLRWSLVESVEGTYNWNAVAELDAQLLDLAQRQVKVTLVVNQAPAWALAVANQYCGPVRPDKYAKLAAFFAEVVKRYSAAPYGVEYYEFGNEEDAAFRTDGTENRSLFGCWGNPADTATYGGRAYGEALKAVYAAAKQAVPSAKIMVGGLLMDCIPAAKPSCNEAKFIDGLLDGSSGSFDGISFHAYDVVQGVTPLGRYAWTGYGTTQENGPILIAKSRYLRERLAARNISGKFLMNTEVGLVVFGGTLAGTFPQPERELTKAYYVAQAYSAAIHEELVANIWFELRGWNGSGLIDSNGNDTKAMTAFKHARNVIGSASKLAVITSADLGGTPNVLGYKLSRNGRQVWVVWSRDGVARTATVAQTPANVTDALGATVSKTAIPISVNPVYIEF